MAVHFHSVSFRYCSAWKLVASVLMRNTEKEGTKLLGRICAHASPPAWIKHGTDDFHVQSDRRATKSKFIELLEGPR